MPNFLPQQGRSILAVTPDQMSMLSAVTAINWTVAPQFVQSATLLPACSRCGQVRVRIARMSHSVETPGAQTRRLVTCCRIHLWPDARDALGSSLEADCIHTRTVYVQSVPVQVGSLPASLLPACCLPPF
jgi:hypothetical protein